MFRFKLDEEDLQKGATVAERTSFTPGLDLGDGAHTLYLQESDSAGNWSSTTSLEIRIDLTPPAQPVFDATPYSPVASLRPTWTWKGGGGGNGTFRLKLDDPDLTTGSDTLTGKSFRPAGDLPEGRHELWVQERDSTGNWSAPTSRTLVTTTRGRVGEAGISAREVGFHFSSLSMDQSGGAYVAFNENSTAPWNVIMKKLKGADWENLGTAYSGGRLTWIHSFAVNPGGIPHVVVLDSLGKGSILRFDGSWNSIGVEPAFPDGMGEPALAFTKTSKPFVVFRDEGRNGKATVIRLNEEKYTWETVGPRGFSNAFSIYFCIAIDKQGIPIVAYLEATEGQALLKVKKFLPAHSSWEDVGIFPGTSSGNHPFSMLLDANDSLFIALRRYESGGAGEVFKYNGAEWVRIGNPLYPPGTYARPVLKADRTGRKYVAFSDATKEDAITLMAFIGGEWIPCGPAGFTLPTTSLDGFISMGFDPNGVPYLLFGEASNGGRATVFKTGFDP